jgi:hypothetical protein
MHRALVTGRGQRKSVNGRVPLQAEWGGVRYVKEGWVMEIVIVTVSMD